MPELLDLTKTMWYAGVDDLIGGWCIMNVNKNPSEMNFRKGDYQIGCFLNKEVAKHIVELHNQGL